MTSLLATALIKPVIALHLLLASPSPTPTDKPASPASFNASAYVTKAHKIRLSIDKTATEPMTVNLRQVGQSAVMFTQHVGRKVAKTTFVLDVAALTDGAYELELKTASGQLVKYIDLKTAPEVVTSPRQLTIR